MSWLEKEIPWKNIKWYVLALLIIDLGHAVVGMWLIQALHLHLSSPGSVWPVMTPLTLLDVAVLVSFEEAVFRLPLGFAMRQGLSIGKVLCLAGISSVIFGILHGGLDHIPVQGLSGFLDCILFIKCAGGGRSIQKAMVAVVSTHYLYDLALIVFLICSGGLTFRAW